jgi:tetratricopeptide (TPR) repeat protein
MQEKSGDISAQLQHPRRSLGNRHRSQSEKFLKLSKTDRKYIGWAEQSVRQAVLHDFTNPKNWKLLVEIKIILQDEIGIRAVLEELFTVLGRDPELLEQLKEVDMLLAGIDLLDAGLRVDPLDPDKWAITIKTSDEEKQKFANRVRILDLRDPRANVLFSRRLERIKEQGDENLFIELERILLAQHPANYEAWGELGKLHERRGEFDQAWFCYDQSQTYFPSSKIRDSFRERMEAKMDGSESRPWVAPQITERLDFLNRMQRLATPDTHVEKISEISSTEETIVHETMEEKVIRLKKSGRIQEAFFYVRSLATNGDQDAIELLDQLRSELE